MKKLIYLFTSLQVFYSQTALFAEDVVDLPPTGNELARTVIMIAMAFLFFYFILWRPEQKRRKELEEQRQALKQGDRVLAMGIIGTVARIQEESVIVKMHDGSKLEFIKAAITEILPESKEDSKKVEKSE